MKNKIEALLKTDVFNEKPVKKVVVQSVTFCEFQSNTILLLKYSESYNENSKYIFNKI